MPSLHALMELLPATIDSIAPDCAIDNVAFLIVEFVPELTKIVVSFQYVPQVTNHEFDDDDVIKVTNHRNVVRKNVLRVAKIHEYRQYALPVRLGQLPANTSRMASMISLSSAYRTAFRDFFSAARKYRKS
jgi:hypothetical protein